MLHQGSKKTSRSGSRLAAGYLPNDGMVPTNRAELCLFSFLSLCCPALSFCSTVSCNAPLKRRALYGTGREQQLPLCSNTSAWVFCWAAPCQEGQIGLFGWRGWKMSNSWWSGMVSGQSSHRLLYLTGQESVPTFRAVCVSRMGNSIWVEREGHSLTLTFKLMIYEPVCVMQLWVVVRLKMYLR